MKKILFLLVGAFIFTAISAQTITVRFEGANNNRDYLVDIDGRKYYSSGTEAASNGARQFVIDDVTIGAHQLALYDNTNHQELYSKTFQLRTGYDMIISIRRNGSVSFREKKMKQVAAKKTNQQEGLTETQFNSVLSSIRAKWSQNSRISAIKTAINNKSYYFTTEQVGQMLQLVTSEARRLELAKLAYPKVTDPQHYADVAQLLTTQANKDNFIAFVQSKNPEIIASGQVSSSGQYASRIAMSGSEFDRLYTKAQLHFRQSSVVADVKAALSNKNNYFTQDQLRALISLASTEANRLALMKLAYHRAADPTTFTQLYNLFNTQASINEMNTYIRNNPS